MQSRVLRWLNAAAFVTSSVLLSIPTDAVALSHRGRPLAVAHAVAPSPRANQIPPLKRRSVHHRPAIDFFSVHPKIM
jgi:hypothetical protein